MNRTDLLVDHPEATIALDGAVVVDTPYPGGFYGRAAGVDVEVTATLEEVELRAGDRVHVLAAYAGPPVGGCAFLWVSKDGRELFDGGPIPCEWSVRPDEPTRWKQ